MADPGAGDQDGDERRADDAGSAEYVFRVRVRVEPRAAGVRIEPDTFETTLYRAADRPGTEGWLFFRDNLWHGKLGDHEHFRKLTEDALGVPIVSVSFSEFRTDEAYLEELRTEVGEHLEEFKADTIDQALSKYLGSSIRVVSDSE